MLADEASDADNDDAEVPDVIMSDPPASFMLSLPESAAAAAAFSDDLKTVQAALGLSAQEVQQLKTEHSAWRSFLVDSQCQLIEAGSRFVLKTVLDLLKCRMFRVNERVHRVAFRMPLLLDKRAANLEVSVEPERGFSFMNGTKTVLRNNLVSKQLNNLMVTGLHSPSIEEAAASGAANERLEAFVNKLVAARDAKKARRCRSSLYNDES